MRWDWGVFVSGCVFDQWNGTGIETSPAPNKNRGRTGKMTCKLMKQAENHKNHPRRSWATNQMGNSDENNHVTGSFFTVFTSAVIPAIRTISSSATPWPAPAWATTASPAAKSPDRSLPRPAPTPIRGRTFPFNGKKLFP
jgi:hypothetical protein